MEQTIILKERSDKMKDKIIIFFIGLLVGAVIATGAFCAYTLVTKDNNSNNQTSMNGCTPPSMNNNSTSNSNSNNMGQPPEKPDESNTNNNNSNSNNTDTNNQNQ